MAERCKGTRIADWRRGVPKGERCRKLVAHQTGYCAEHRHQWENAQPSDPEPQS